MFNQKILAEQGEVFKAPNGQIQKISNNAPSHDDNKRINKFGINKVEGGEGGVEINADSVLSDSQRQVNSGKREDNIKEQIVKIKPIEGENIAGQLGLNIKLKKAISPSQLFLEIQKAKDKKTLDILKKSKNSTNSREGQNSNDVNASQIAILPSDEEIYDAVFEHTENKKEQSGIDFEEEIEAQFGFDKNRQLREYKSQTNNMYLKGGNSSLSDFNIFPSSPEEINEGKYESSFKEHPVKYLEDSLAESEDFLNNWYGKREGVEFDHSMFDYDLKNRFRGDDKNAAAFYSSKDNKSYFNTEQFQPLTGIHEFTHSIDYNAGNNLKTNYEDLGIKPTFIAENKNRYEQYKSNKENGFSDEYYKSPMEVYARLNELRRKANFSPNFIPSLEDIRNLRNSTEDNQIFSFFSDEDILNMWNNLSLNKNEKPKEEYYAKYGLRKSQFGGDEISKRDKNPFNTSNVKSQGKKTALEQANWLSNWYGTRDVVTDPVAIDTNLYDYEYYPDKNNRPKNVKENVQKIENAYGFEPYAYADNDKTIFLNKVSNTTVPVHEFTHRIDANLGDLKAQYISNPVKKAYLNNFGNTLKTDYRDLGIKPLKEDKYFTNPQESYARLNELRYNSKFEPNYKPTIDDIKKLRKTNKNNQLFKYYDDDSIMKMWNGLSDIGFEENTLENPILEQTAKYGGIHIKPENKGKFTEYAKRKGMGVQEAAHWVMSNSDNPTLRKRANFAINASKFKHQYGGSSILSQLNLL